MVKVLFIGAEWDAEATVWVATSDDVPGLATEAETLDALAAKLECMVPELLDANAYPEGPDIPFELLARRICIHFPVDQKIKSRHTGNAVLKQAGLPRHF